jgi:hypothetical protein
MLVMAGAGPLVLRNQPSGEPRCILRGLACARGEHVFADPGLARLHAAARERRNWPNGPSLDGLSASVVQVRPARRQVRPRQAARGV